jgi:hypothetical protein
MHRRFQHAARQAALVVTLVAIVQPAWAVDGVIEINQARATAGGVTPGDTPGFPVTLDQSGSYRLTGNLTVADAGATAIVATVGNVTIDLNGFTIACNTGVAPCAAGAGTGINANQVNVAVLNGTVRDMGGSGINTGANARIERVRALGNHSDGIRTGNASSLTGNTANDNGNDGLVPASAATSSTTRRSTTAAAAWRPAPTA